MNPIKSPGETRAFLIPKPTVSTTNPIDGHHTFLIKLFNAIIDPAYDRVFSLALFEQYCLNVYLDEQLYVSLNNLYGLFK